MRSSGRWMMQIDERILEYLDDEGWGTPATMKDELGCTVSEKRLKSRCKSLCERELVAPVHGDMYEITRWGQAYLRGNLDAHHLPRYPLESG
jgi:hypothetical protein